MCVGGATHAKEINEKGLPFGAELRKAMSRADEGAAGMRHAVHVSPSTLQDEPIQRNVGGDSLSLSVDLQDPGHRTQWLSAKPRFTTGFRRDVYYLVETRVKRLLSSVSQLFFF